jgi:hypothetical protein
LCAALPGIVARVRDAVSAPPSALAAHAVQA